RRPCANYDTRASPRALAGGGGTPWHVPPCVTSGSTDRPANCAVGSCTSGGTGCARRPRDARRPMPRPDHSRFPSLWPLFLAAAAAGCHAPSPAPAQVKPTPVLGPGALAHRMASPGAAAPLVHNGCDTQGFVPMDVPRYPLNDDTLANV